MKVLTIATWKSIRETDKARRYRKFYSTENLRPGDVIEITEGKRRPAIVLKVESAASLKQQIRDGSVEIEKLDLPKDWKVLEQLDMAEVKAWLKDPALAHKSGNVWAKKLFPKHRTFFCCFLLRI